MHWRSTSWIYCQYTGFATIYHVYVMYAITSLKNGLILKLKHNKTHQNQHITIISIYIYYFICVLYVQLLIQPYIYRLRCEAYFNISMFPVSFTTRDVCTCIYFGNSYGIKYKCSVSFGNLFNFRFSH